MGWGPGTVRVARWGASGGRAVMCWRDFIAGATCQQHVLVRGLPANMPHLPVRLRKINGRRAQYQPIAVPRGPSEARPGTP